MHTCIQDRTRMRPGFFPLQHDFSESPWLRAFSHVKSDICCQHWQIPVKKEWTRKVRLLDGQSKWVRSEKYPLVSAYASSRNFFPAHLQAMKVQAGRHFLWQNMRSHTTTNWYVNPETKWNIFGPQHSFLQYLRPCAFSFPNELSSSPNTLKAPP